MKIGEYWIDYNEFKMLSNFMKYGIRGCISNLEEIKNHLEEYSSYSGNDYFDFLL